MEADDVIEPHHGPVTWLSNPVLVPKADGSMSYSRSKESQKSTTRHSPPYPQDR